MSGWIMYCVVSVLWGIFAARMQLLLFPNYSKWAILDASMCAIVNAVLCPISMICTIYEMFTNAYWTRCLNQKNIDSD